MESRQCLNWVILALICPLSAGAPSSLSGEDSCSLDGTVMKHRCLHGYYASVPSRRCQNGLWTPKITTIPAECKKITCPNPRVFENGEVMPTQVTYFVNDTITYSCHSEYRFLGSKDRVCQPNGKWSGSTAICGRDTDHCPDPGVPPGSSRTGNIFNIDDKIMYRCESPLILVGSKVRACKDGGQWSGTEPECYADFTYDTAEEASKAFGGSLKKVKYEEEPYGKKIYFSKGGNLDIYIAVDASDSIEKDDFDKIKLAIKTLIEKISYYEVSPSYEILMFAADVTRTVTIRDFKTNTNSRHLNTVFEDLDKFDYDKMGDRKGTNITNLYKTIFNSMSLEEQINKEEFLNTQHVVILLTNGRANLGENPKSTLDQIRNLIIKKDPNRVNKLDLYVFGFGMDMKKEYMNGLVSEKNDEKYFFKLQDSKEVQKAFELLDDSTAA